MQKYAYQKYIQCVFSINPFSSDINFIRYLAYEFPDKNKQTFVRSMGKLVLYMISDAKNYQTVYF